MLSMELWHYRRHCRETTPAEKQLLRDHEPYLTPMGRRWRARTLAPRQQLSSTPASCMPTRVPASGRSAKATFLASNVKRAKHNNKTNKSATSDPRLNRAKATSSNTQPRYGRHSFQHDEDNDAESDVNSSSSNSGNSSSSSSSSSEEEEDEEEVQEQDDEVVTNGNDFRGKSTNKGWTTSSLLSTSAAGSRRAQRPKPRKGTTH